MVSISFTFLVACSVFCFYRFFYCFNFGKENSASGGSFPLAGRGSSPRKQRWKGIRSQISPSAEGLDKIIPSKMPWVNLCPFLYLKILSLISSNSVNPFFSSKRIIWKLEVRNFFPIFVQITFLCTFRNKAARRHFYSDQRLLSDKFAVQTVQVYRISTFLRQGNKNNSTSQINLEGICMFFHRTALGDKSSDLTCLAMMWLVPTPPEQSAIMKVVYHVVNWQLSKQGIHWSIIYRFSQG